MNHPTVEDAKLGVRHSKDGDREMPDHIKTSVGFSGWLKSQGIPPIQVDKFAPIVVEWEDTGTEVTTPNSLYMGLKNTAYRCPYFGPGGEGNLLKALRAIEMKDPKSRLFASNECHEEGCPCWEDPDYPNTPCGPCKTTHTHKQPAWQFYPNPPLDRENHCFPYYWVWGDSDGEAMRNLLLKLMEGK